MTQHWQQSNYKRVSKLTPDQRERIQVLRDLLTIEVPGSIQALVELRDTATRCATRERAASRLLTLYYNAITIESGYEQEEEIEQIPVMIVSDTQLEAASERAQQLRAEKQAAKKLTR